LDDYLLICNDLHLDYYRQCDELLLESLEQTGKVIQITESRLRNAKKVFFPYLCFLGQADRSKSSKLTHPLLPKSTEWLKQRKFPYSFYPLISKKGRQKLLHTAVILDSSVLGL
jgi:hypothetical protein